MPKEDEKKIKSAPKSRRSFSKSLYISAVLSIVFICLALVFYFVSREPAEQSNTGQPSCNGVQLSLGCYNLEKATTNEQRIKGLSGRDSLPEKTGMLFVFDTVEEQCFWMKEMKFSIDILWLNEAKEIMKIEKNVSPGTYPESFCAQQTKYVLEFNPGVSSQNGLKVGSTVQF